MKMDRKCPYSSLMDGRKPSLEEGLPDIQDVTSFMREKLVCFFMNPIEKWKLRGRFPWKLFLQLLIAFTCIWQMYTFGSHRSQHVKVTSGLTSTLSRILLKDWSQFPYFVFTAPQFFDNVDYAITQFGRVSSLSTGAYDYDLANPNFNDVKICVNQYDGIVDPGKAFIGIVGVSEEKCWTASSIPVKHETFSIKDMFEKSNFTLNFGTFISAKINVRLKATFLKSLSKIGYPECYVLNLQIKYDNSDHNGPIPVSLTIKSAKVICQVESTTILQVQNTSYYLCHASNVCVALLSFVSILLCLRSLCRGYRLFKQARWFFQHFFEEDIPFSESLEFVDFWYIIIIIGDAMLVLASLLKLNIEEMTADSSEYTTCSVFLGLGYLLILVGILRYFKFFPGYNVLILTVQKSLPKAIRFFICIMVLFSGYSFCGWIVLAPYHPKFISLSTTAEGLFAAMNGDDVFGSFSSLTTDQEFIWWFTRLYLYSFFFLFLYLATSLLISVLMDTFDVIKQGYTVGETPSTRIQLFLASKDYIPISSSEHKTSDVPTETTELMSVNEILSLWLKQKIYE